MAPSKRKRNAATNTSIKRRKNEPSSNHLEDEFPAERISKEQRRSGKLYYYIHWKGNDKRGNPWEPTWEPAEYANKLLVEAWQEEKASRNHSNQTSVQETPVLPAGSKSRVGERSSEPAPAPSIRNSSEPSTPARESASVVSASSNNTSPLGAPTAGPHARALLEVRVPPATHIDRNEFDPYSQLPLSTAQSETQVSEFDTPKPLSAAHDYRSSGVVPDSQSQDGEATYVPTQESSEAQSHSTTESLVEEDRTEGLESLELVQEAKAVLRHYSRASSVAETEADPIEDSQAHVLQKTAHRELGTIDRIEDSSQVERVSGNQDTQNIAEDNQSRKGRSGSADRPILISPNNDSSVPFGDSEIHDQIAATFNGEQDHLPHSKEAQSAADSVTRSQPSATEEPSVEQQAQIIPVDTYLSTQDESIRPTIEHDEYAHDHASPNSRHDSSQESPQPLGQNSSSIPHPPQYSVDMSESNPPPRPRTPEATSSSSVNVDREDETASWGLRAGRQAMKELEESIAKRLEENPWTPRNIYKPMRTSKGIIYPGGTRSPSTIPDRLPAMQAPTSLRTVAVANTAEPPAPEPESRSEVLAEPESAPEEPERPDPQIEGASIPLIVHPIIDEELSDADEEDDADDDDDASLLNDDLQLISEEYIVPLFIEGRQSNAYTGHITKQKDLLEKFLADTESFEPLADVEAVVNQLGAIETHLDLLFSESQLPSQTLGSATQIQFDAQWGTENSVKFRFLSTLLHRLRDHDLHIVIVMNEENDALINIIENFCKAKFFNYNLPTKGRQAAETEWMLLLTVIPSDSTHIIQSPDFIICLDGNQDADSIRKKNWARNPKTTEIPVLHLVVPRTVGHIQRYVSSKLGPRERLRTILASLAQLRAQGVIGNPVDDDTPRPMMAAEKVAGWFLSGVEDEELGRMKWPLPSIGSVKDIIEFQTQLSQDEPDSTVMSKRPLENDDQEPAKRMRFTPQPQTVPTSSLNHEDNEVTRISDSMPRTAVDIEKLQEQLLLKEKQYQREREARKAAEKQFREHTESWDLQQNAHEDLTRKYRLLLGEQEITTSRLETVTKTVETLRDRLIARSSENKELETRHKALEATLLVSEDDKVARIAQLEKEVADANDAKQKALKSISITESTLEYTKEQYRTTQDTASKLRTENEALTARLTKAEQLASGEVTKLKQRFDEQMFASQGRRIDLLNTENANMRKQLQAKEEEITKLKNSRNVGVGTRAQSVGPKTPRPGSRAASPAVRDRLMNLRNG